jgi:histidinol phosphatase-like enzyme
LVFAQDGTLITRKSDSQMPFSVSPNDWKWFNKKVPSILEEYHAKGYVLVVFR